MTPDQLKEASEMWKQGRTVREMAEHFGISPKQMHTLVRGGNRPMFPERSDQKVKQNISLTAFIDRGGNVNRMSDKFPAKAPKFDVNEETGEPLVFYFEGVTASKLKECGCKFPLWNHRDRFNFDTDTFCGAPRIDGKPYCQFHCDVARGPGTRSERDAPRALKKAAA